MRHSVRCTRSCAASPETVYDLLADPERWPQWLAGVRTAGWVEPGEVRRIVVSGLTMREEVLVSDRPHHHAYTILSGIPVSDHRADVRITPRPRGCLITWTATFRGRIPGTGPLLWLMLRASTSTMVNALARGAESRA
ncbi:SRPBCC family protein [Mycobacterium sp. 852013-51886_SCH5428379]|uniref:SRPBCC family protein n=1 Tax=Mycobacterium sp. 852013-51886_SCH5428379 TaxID=1834111 RepID=UPI0009EDD586|nr:SRPBCC family protein [Mycobacterium sp. 852013-51886_SCH5428379]